MRAVRTGRNEAGGREEWSGVGSTLGGIVRIAVIGTGFIGGILGRALAGAGHDVTFGSRHPGDEDVAQDSGATVASIGDALTGADVVILALPGDAVGALASEHGD